ncbi:hypothetical protein QC762_0069090 [Podospora pseudocomata]|uniref:Uncharacterized protein n=1 Tax=Podospora pseudocomata TaxID=2093779 RepID=A0ABR0GGA8_9PEZI|nr:hypothetical protein QC762_0069090 [Podospora pseudocomata]
MKTHHISLFPLQRPALPDHIQHRDAHPPFGVAPLVIQRPRKDIGYTRKDTPGSQKNRKIPDRNEVFWQGC